tara:strand:+ start:172 stop:582 length:411 start_codon:yes stop_codon:yes gene_type:complete
MTSRSQKYYGEQDPRHGSQLQWPGAQGLPFRGDAVPNVKQEELEKLPVVGEAFQQTFDLTDEEQAKSYRWVRDRIRNGMFTQDYVHREHILDEDKNELRTLVYLEWTQLYVQVPHNSHSGVTANGSASQKFTFRSE